MAANAAIPIFNPQARIHTELLANGLSCVVVDNALLDPERLLQFAVAQQQTFRRSTLIGRPTLSGFFTSHRNIA